MKSENNFEIDSILVDDERKMKPFCSVDELIVKLQESKINPLTFDENETLFAKEFFTYTNYYSFSIYRKYLPNDSRDYSFTDCMKIYDFNTFLRNELTRFTGKIELMLKSSFVKSLCQNYDGNLQKGECYLDPIIYKNENLYEEELEVIIKRLNDRIKTLPIEHHVKKKNCKFPFWVLVPELTFGEMTMMISSMKKEIELSWIHDSFLDLNRINAAIYGEEICSKMFGWFSSVWYLRNICAHYGRLYGVNFTIGCPSQFAQHLDNVRSLNTRSNQSHADSYLA